MNESTEGGTMITHDNAIAAQIRMDLDNALDDMHDDGIRDEWINAIAERRNSLISLIALRHAMNCTQGAEPLNCDECDDDDFDMHFTMHDDTSPCYSLITEMVYGGFIRPRWETEPKMAVDDHIIHHTTN